MDHGHNRRGARTPTYNSWVGMCTRARNANRPNADRYVGRGITMAPEWSDFSVFLADMGERPEGHTLERRNNDLGYSRDNCCWATPKTQRRNTSHCVYVLLAEERMLVVDALAKIGRDWRHYRGARWGRKRRSAQEAIDHLVACNRSRSGCQ